MGNNRVLLVGTSFSAIPLLQYLKKNNFHVSVCGGLKNDPCHHYADQSFYIDYSNKNKLLELCQQNEFDFLIPTCNDYSYNSASYVATQLNKFYGFDTFEITNILHTKSGFRAFAIEHNLSVPQAIKYSVDLDLDTLSLSYPLLVKPDDSFSGQGVTKVFTKNELNGAVETAKNNSKNSDVILEEFVEGNLYSHSAFIQDGRILIDFFVNEFCTVYPYQVDSSCLTHQLKEETLQGVRADIQKLVTLLDISDGLLHTQFISDDTKFWLIETMRRCPGDLYGSLINKSTNFPYIQSYVNPFLNRKNSSEYTKINKFVARHTLTVQNDQFFQSFQVDFSPSKSVEIVPLKESGYYLEKAPLDKIGIIFAEFDSIHELNNYTPNMKYHIKINPTGEAQ